MADTKGTHRRLSTPSTPENLDLMLSGLNTPELMAVFRKQFLTRPELGPQASLVKLLFRPSSDGREKVDPARVEAVARRDEVDAAAIDAVLRVPSLGSTEAGQLLRKRGVISSSNASDALRKLAQDGRLIGLRHNHRWHYPAFQLHSVDPRDDNNPVVVVNKLLDAARYPWSATSWWTTPSGSLPDHRSPAELLGDDDALLVELARAHAAGPDL
ncbi:UNVERIFIED_ORG: hypothetical protein EDC92_12415 [Dietzia maris]|uniref:hypothetical protein n=1 Tax=Dietzia maris TaxID=37915 RepID=UPI0010504584